MPSPWALAWIEMKTASSKIWTLVINFISYNYTAQLVLTIWWWGSSNVRTLGNVEYPFITIAPRSSLAQSGSTW